MAALSWLLIPLLAAVVCAACGAAGQAGRRTGIPETAPSSPVTSGSVRPWRGRGPMRPSRSGPRRRGLRRGTDRDRRRVDPGRTGPDGATDRPRPVLSCHATPHRDDARLHPDAHRAALRRSVHHRAVRGDVAGADGEHARRARRRAGAADLGPQDVRDDRPSEHDHGPGHRRRLPDEPRRGRLRLARARQRGRAARHALPDGKTEEQSTQENAEEFSQSQESAKVAALKELDIPVQSRVIVSTVVKDTPAEGKLHAGDVIKAVDGTAVKEPDDVAKLVTKHKPGEKVVFTIVPGARRRPPREGASGAVRRVTEKRSRITTEKADDDGDARDRRHPGRDRPHLPVRHRHQARRRRRPERRADVRPRHRRQADPGQTSPAASSWPAPAPSTTRARSAPIGGIEMKTVGARAKGATVLPDADGQLRGRRQGHPRRAHAGEGRTRSTTRWTR